MPDLDAQQFATYFRLSVDLLGLSDEDVARLFSASKSTAARWKAGHPPAPGFRRLVVRDLHHMLLSKES